MYLTILTKKWTFWDKESQSSLIFLFLSRNKLGLCSCKVTSNNFCLICLIKIRCLLVGIIITTSFWSQKASFEAFYPHLWLLKRSRWWWAMEIPSTKRADGTGMRTWYSLNPLAEIPYSSGEHVTDRGMLLPEVSHFKGGWAGDLPVVLISIWQGSRWTLHEKDYWKID